MSRREEDKRREKAYEDTRRCRAELVLIGKQIAHNKTCVKEIMQLAKLGESPIVGPGQPLPPGADPFKHAMMVSMFHILQTQTHLLAIVTDTAKMQERSKRRLPEDQ